MAFNITVNEKFRNAFEQKCFQLIIEAYQTSLEEKVIQLDWDENDISQELLEKIDNNRLRLKWNISISREYYLSKDVKKLKGFADHLPRLDLRFTNIFGLEEHNFFCEAKRLKEKDSRLKRDYIKEGIDRYVTKKYPLGSLVGYLLEGDSCRTIKGINSLLEKDKRNTEVLILRSSKLLKNYYESFHSGLGIIKHLIFDFTIISN